MIKNDKSGLSRNGIEKIKQKGEVSLGDLFLKIFNELIIKINNSKGNDLQLSDLKKM